MQQASTEQLTTPTTAPAPSPPPMPGTRSVHTYAAAFQKTNPVAGVAGAAGNTATAPMARLTFRWETQTARDELSSAQGNYGVNEIEFFEGFCLADPVDECWTVGWEKTSANTFIITTKTRDARPATLFGRVVCGSVVGKRTW